MRIVRDKISLHELLEMAKSRFGDMVKAVVDIKQRLMAVDGEMHSDEEAELLQAGSNNQDLWGINIYPEKTIGDWIEFDSMINLRPRQGNCSRGVEDAKTREKIINIVDDLVER